MDRVTQHWLIHTLLDDNISFSSCIALIKEARAGAPLTKLKKADLSVVDEVAAKTEEMGVIGNVWVRQQYYPKKDCPYNGHKHNHDHLSLLATGSIEIHVEGCKPARYTAPAFFNVKAGLTHQIIPLEDETIAYCIFALRNKDGEVVEEFDGNTRHYGAVK